MTGEVQDNIWPLPKFYFAVDLGPGLESVAFQEVTGLDTESQPIEYRAGPSGAFSTIKMPGLVKAGNVTLKKGIFVNDNHFWNWFNQIRMNTIKRRSVTISLLDQEANPTMVWKLANAWPTKISATDLKSDGNEIAVDTIELIHESLTIANG